MSMGELKSQKPNINIHIKKGYFYYLAKKVRAQTNISGIYIASADDRDSTPLSFQSHLRMSRVFLSPSRSLQKQEQNQFHTLRLR